jgi:hypothetical protein
MVDWSGGVSTTAAIGRSGWDRVVVWMGLRLRLRLWWHGLFVVEVFKEVLLDRPAQYHRRTLRRCSGSLGSGDDSVGGALGHGNDLGRLLARARSVGGGVVELGDAVGALEIGAERHAEGAGAVEPTHRLALVVAVDVLALDRHLET